MVALNFNPTSVDPNVGFEPVPSGNYLVMITKSEEKPTKAGTGSYLELTLAIQDGEFKGRTVFERLNIRNPNEQTMEIAYRTLSSICYVVGHLQHLADTQQLHGRPFRVNVTKDPRDDRPDLFSNNVRGYFDVNGNAPGSNNSGGQGGGQPQGGGNTPAWAGNNGGGQPQGQAQQNQQVQQGQAQQQQQQTQQQQQPQTQQGGAPASTDTPPWVN